MKVAITNPTNWPHVRRGVERFINELARYLAARGHHATILSAQAGPRATYERDGYRTIMHSRYWRPWMERHGILEFHAFFLNALQALLRERYDVVLCCTFMDAYAASLARTITGCPSIFWVNGLPPPIRYFRSRSMKGAVFNTAIHRSDEVVALSAYMQKNLSQRFGRGGVQIAAPVNADEFQLARNRDLSRPAILCTAALDDRRKGGKLLMQSFDRVKLSQPEARLQISCRLTGEQRDSLLSYVSPKFRDSVEFLGTGRLSDLPELIGSAAVSVLASRWEPFGMVVLESLATGTPVAATRDGALPEILTDPMVSRLFDPGPEEEPEPQNLEGLTRAILECIELSADQRTADRCRAHALQYSWDAIGPQIEQLLIQTAGKANRKKPA